MKKYLITNPKYTGAAEVVYGSNGLLQQIDVTATSMDANTITAFKKAVTATEADLLNSFGPQTNILAAEVAVSFEMFWAAYKKKINRLRAEALWNKLSKTEQVEAFVAIANYDKYLKKEHWRSKADPDTYLRNKYYQNEYR